MGGKPLIVAILAGMVVAMIGVVFIQKAPEGFVVSSLLRVGNEQQEALEAQLRKDAAAQLAAEQNKAIDPHSIGVVKSAQQGNGDGIDVTVQAQGENSRTAMDYLNELLVRYARRQGKVEETVSTKLEISDAERKLTAALKEKETAMERIEANEKEIKQLQIREQIEAQQVAKASPQAETRNSAPKIEAPAEADESVIAVETTPKSRRQAPVVEVQPELPVLESPKRVATERTPGEVNSEENSAEPLRLSEEERKELVDALRFLKSDRMRLINGGRRPSHPAVQDLDRQIQDINSKLQPKAKSAARHATRKVKFEYVTSQAKERSAATTRQRRVKLEKELVALNQRLEKVERIEIEQKARLAKLVEAHVALDAAFKPVILAPAKVVTTIQPPFPLGRLIGTVFGAVIAGTLGYILAKLGERPRTLSSISEAEMVLRMPVQTIERPMVRRRVA